MKRVIAFLLFAISLPAHAGIVIYGTRVIYPSDKQEIVVQLMNQGTRTSLIQSWIDEGDTSKPPEQIQVPFLLTPPVARVAANSGQQLKIKKMPGDLPQNKESLFFLNVLDIPPNDPQNAGKNVIKFATQNRVKLIWRPTGIAPVNKSSFQKLSLSAKNNSLMIKNDTANWITLTDIMANHIKVNEQSIMISPFSTETLTLKSVGIGQYSLTIIDDNGNYISETIKIK